MGEGKAKSLSLPFLSLRERRGPFAALAANGK
jgi:hypothetical protein